MTKIAIYKLSSELSGQQSGDDSGDAFLNSLHADFDYCGSNFSDYGSHPLDLIYVGTGGTEGLFLNMLPRLRVQSDRPFFLLASGMNNSLPASLEILAYLQQEGFRGEIIHGDSEYVSHRIGLLLKLSEVRRMLLGARLGVIGHPSDWLISSHADNEKLHALGVHIVDIPMNELLRAISMMPAREVPEVAPTEEIRQSLPGVAKIYKALRAIIGQYQLRGFTLRCFDLLSAVHNTGCLALAKLNSEGIVAGCEGDVPALVSMAITQAVTGVSGFQANPCAVNAQTGEVVFAHCTIPLNMVERHELDTHFESGIGVGVRGYMKEGPVTVFKVSGDLSRHFIAEGQLVPSEPKPDLCRTQLVVRLSDPSLAAYFLTRPIGNHHIVMPGHHRELLESVLGT